MTEQQKKIENQKVNNLASGVSKNIQEGFSFEGNQGFSFQHSFNQNSYNFNINATLDDSILNSILNLINQQEEPLDQRESKTNNPGQTHDQTLNQNPSSSAKFSIQSSVQAKGRDQHPSSDFPQDGKINLKRQRQNYSFERQGMQHMRTSEQGVAFDDDDWSRLISSESFKQLSPRAMIERIETFLQDKNHTNQYDSSFLSDDSQKSKRRRDSKYEQKQFDKRFDRKETERSVNVSLQEKTEIDIMISKNNEYFSPENEDLFSQYVRGTQQIGFISDAAVAQVQNQKFLKCEKCFQNSKFSVQKNAINEQEQSAMMLRHNITDQERKIWTDKIQDALKASPEFLKDQIQQLQAIQSAQQVKASSLQGLPQDGQQPLGLQQQKQKVLKKATFAIIREQNEDKQKIKLEGDERDQVNETNTNQSLASSEQKQNSDNLYKIGKNFQFLFTEQRLKEFIRETFKECIQNMQASQKIGSDQRLKNGIAQSKSLINQSQPIYEGMLDIYKKSCAVFGGKSKDFTQTNFNGLGEKEKLRHFIKLINKAAKIKENSVQGMHDYLDWIHTLKLYYNHYNNHKNPRNQ